MDEPINTIDLERWIATRFVKIKNGSQVLYWNGMTSYTEEQMKKLFEKLTTPNKKPTLPNP